MSRPALPGSRWPTTLRAASHALLLFLCAAPPAFAVLPPFGSAEGKPDDPRQFAGCTVLRWERQAWTWPSLFIRDPGKYCIDRDYSADLRGCIHGCGGQIINIKANNVELDLRGHTLKINRYTGILAVGDNIIIRNGRIKGGGIGVAFDAPSPPGLPTAKAFSPSGFQIAYERSRVAVYGPGGARLENLVIETDDQPIDAAGANVTVIGSTIRTALVPEDKATVEYRRKYPDSPRRFIETSPPALLSIYGPGSVVEGNTFELTNRTGGQVSAHAILLRDAKGAIVRNNRIRNVGSKSKTVAIGLKDSPGVVTEANTFVNIETPVAPFGSESATADKPKR